MRPRDAFEICAEVYVYARGVEMRQIGSSHREVESKYLWRPDVLPRPLDYCADFEVAGRRALREPRLRGRLRLFLFYYVACLEYRAVLARLDISELTFSLWCDDIRDLVGRELLRAHIFPTGSYFKCARLGLHAAGHAREKPRQSRP